MNVVLWFFVPIILLFTIFFLKKDHSIITLMAVFVFSFISSGPFIILFMAFLDSIGVENVPFELFIICPSLIVTIISLLFIYLDKGSMNPVLLFSLVMLGYWAIFCIIEYGDK